LSTPRRALRAAVVDAHGRPLHVAGLSSWLTRIAPASARGEVNIALVTDPRIRALNREFRGRDAVTDVLSFSQGPNPKAQVPGLKAQSPRPRRRPPTAHRPPPVFLGDIVIARGAARRQARTAGHSELTELRILALHGLLHLLGYDHHGKSHAMARLERRLRKAGGLREGLIERAHRL
jgi:probable rRNA maturation factor